MRQQNKARQVTLQLGAIWTEVVECLSLRQLDSCLGGDMSYKSKAQRAMKVSKNETVQALCIEMIQLYESHFEADLNFAQIRIDLSDFE